MRGQMNDGGPVFPIQGSPTIKSIPWSLIEPHEAQAQHNHGQTLKRLAERMGLSSCEAVAILENRTYRERWPQPIITRDEMRQRENEADKCLSAMLTQRKLLGDCL